MEELERIVGDWLFFFFFFLDLLRFCPGILTAA